VGLFEKEQGAIICCQYTSKTGRHIVIDYSNEEVPRLRWAILSANYSWSSVLRDHNCQLRAIRGANNLSCTWSPDHSLRLLFATYPGSTSHGDERRHSYAKWEHNLFSLRKCLWIEEVNRQALAHHLRGIVPPEFTSLTDLNVSSRGSTGEELNCIAEPNYLWPFRTPAPKRHAEARSRSMCRIRSTLVAQKLNAFTKGDFRTIHSRGTPVPRIASTCSERWALFFGAGVGGPSGVT